jgi:glycosyltransferase involved in cell wall biosynthesis
MKIMQSLFLNYKKYKIFLIVFFLAIISLIIVAPLVKSGLPPTHDGEYHIVRAYQFDKTLRDGNFYPRWLPDLNYGYGTPLLNYYYPLPYYAMSFVHFFGVSFIDAFKVSLFIATILGAIFFFLWARIFWGNSGGFIASIFYTFAPYHIVELYVRGVIGEVWALAFFPAFLWAITKGIKEKNDLFFPVASIFLALIIFSHNILAIMFFPFSLSYIFLLLFINKSKPYVIRYAIYTIIVGVLLAAIFWLPALMERKYVSGLQIYNVKESFPELYQLIIPVFGQTSFFIVNKNFPTWKISSIYTNLQIVGDVTWNKNLPRLVEAVKKTNIPFVMVGKALAIKDFDRTNSWNQDLALVQKLVKDDKQFVLPGFVEDNDLVYLYRMATVFVMPSFYEGFGLPILEAMSSGCAVVTSPNGSLKEVGGDAVCYINPESKESIAHGLMEVFLNKKFRTSLIEKGIQQSKKFSWQKTAQNTIRVYETVYKS